MLVIEGFVYIKWMIIDILNEIKCILKGNLCYLREYGLYVIF